MLLWGGVPLVLRFLQTPRRFFPFPHSTYLKTILSMLRQWLETKMSASVGDITFVPAVRPVVRVI